MPTELNISLSSNAESPTIKFVLTDDLAATLSGSTPDVASNIKYVATGVQGDTGQTGASGVDGTAVINAGSVTESKLANNSVTSNKISSSAVTSSKLSNNSVTTSKIANNAITADKIAPGVVTSELLADGIISSNKIGEASIQTNKLENGSVTTVKIAANTITKAKIAAKTLSGAEIEDDVVLDGAKIRGSVQLLGESPAFLKGPSQDVLNIQSERDLVFRVDSNNDQTSSFLYKNGAGTTVFSIDESGNVTTVGTVAGRNLAADGAKLDGISDNEAIDWTVAQTSNIHSGNYTDTNTQLTVEEVQDIVGAMLSSNTETRITVTYDDSDGTIDFVVDDMTADTNTQLPLIDSDTMTGALSTNVASAESVKAYVDNEVAGIVDSAPGTLNTLNELAQALNDDAAFSTTVTDSIALKAPIASPTFTGTIAIPNITDVESAITANTAKTGITTSQANAITANTAKNTYPSADATKLAGIAVGATANTGDVTLTTTQTISGNKTLNNLRIKHEESDGIAFIRFYESDDNGSHYVDLLGSDELDNNYEVVIPNASGDLALTTDINANRVAGAGALMDSEVTNLAQVKAFSSSDYATAAQGIKADSAQQPPTEGAFVDGDKTKLNGIAVGAEVNVQSDWNSSSGDSQILNKPTIPAAYADADAVSAVAAADDYIKNDADDVLNGSLTINNSIFLLDSGSGATGTKSKIINRATTANQTLDVPDASGIIALTNSLIDTKTAAYWSSSTSGFYITLSGASTSENTSLSTASYTLMYVAPFDGKIKRISSFHQNAASGTSTFEIYIDGDDSDLTNDQRGSDMTTSSFTRKFTEDCPADWTFSKGEAIAIKRTDSVARYGVTMTIVFEYDTTT